MGTSTLMSIGTRAMFANYAALQTTGNNIANANTPGYSRQQVSLETAKGQFTGAGFFGQGVNVASVTRSYDSFLTTQAANSNSLASADASRLDQLTQLENVFPLGENGMGYAAGQLLNSFVDVASNPQDASARQVAMTRATEMASRFKTAGEQLATLQAGVTADLISSVATVNGLAQRMADVNKQIAALQGAGHPANDLLDERDKLISDISGFVNVTTLPAEDGSVGVFIGGGQSLVLGATTNTLKASLDPFDPSKVQLSMLEGSKERAVKQDAITGGSMAGLVHFQNEDLSNARSLLGQMAVAITGAMNQQQSLGLNLGQPPSFGSPLFSVAAPRTLPAASNSGDASLSVKVSDFTHVQASDYELKYDGANYSLTRLSDQHVMGSAYAPADLAAGIQVDGMTIQLNSGTPGTGDRFLLRPVSDAAIDMKTVLSDPKGLAAASPVTATFGVNNTGTAAVASLQAVSTSLDRTLTAKLSFTSGSGDFSYDMVDASNAVVSSGTGSWTAGQPIALNGFELQLNGVPRNGDTLQVSPTVATAANNGNALAIVNLAKTGFVGKLTNDNGSESPGRTVTDAYASAISEIGVRVQSSKSAAGISSAAAGSAEAARANKAGVNLDEEAARLIQYQQSYQAAAKMLQVAQSIFDTLLQTAGG